MVNDQTHVNDKIILSKFHNAHCKKYVINNNNNKFIYNVPVPVLQKQAPSTLQLHISGSVHS